jgi:hypothetical protein
MAQPKNPASSENETFKHILEALILFIPVAGGILMYIVLTASGAAPQTLVATSTPASTVALATETPIATAVPGTPTPSAAGAALLTPVPQSTPGMTPGALGVFDSAAGLPLFARALVAVIIFFATGLLELFFVLLYAALFVNDPSNYGLPLGLPPATVRVFLIIVVVVVLIMFTLLPDVWGNNKAVVLLFGFLATVIGFYFGSRTASAGTDNSPTSVNLSLADPKTWSLTPPHKPVAGTLDKNFQAVLGTPVPPVVAMLFDRASQPVSASQVTAIVDALGHVEFDFSVALGAASVGDSFVLRVITPSSISCDQRVTVTA